MQIVRKHKFFTVYTTDMKIKSLSATIKAIVLLPAITLLLIAPDNLMACEACNRAFLGELLGKEKFNSVVYKDLLTSIARQETNGGNHTKWVNDVMAMNNMTMADLHTDAPSAPELQQTEKMATSPGQSGIVSGSRSDFIDIIRRDNNLPIPATSYVPQDTKPDKYVRISLEEGDTYLGNGVMYKGFTIDKKIPGPTIIVEEGDVVSFKIVNEGNIVHGASIHAVNSQTSKYLGKIYPGDSASVVFKANMPGIYMYHCAPGGHAIPMHIIFGQYGMIVVKPKKKYELERILNKEPDIEIYLLQHEYYASGKDAVDGQGKPMYTAFNGKLFRYIEDPIIGKPGDYVRINFLNTGPNLMSTFHIVGIVWDFAYWQGHPDNRFTGGQTVLAGPSDSWVIEFRIPPDEGNYLMLSHAVGSTDRGALGLLISEKEADTPKTILSDGPLYSEEELEAYRIEALRTITPFGLGSPDVEVPVVYGSETSEVIVRIIGNSYYPKVVQVAPGTTIKWINEDVFTFMDGEFSGIHNVVVKNGPERFASELLAHAQSYSRVMETAGEYIYFCTPHPYMEAKIIVKGEQAKKKTYTASVAAENSVSQWIMLVMVALSLVIAVMALIRRGSSST
jgi:nitrite reductase (NO-forming)